MTIAVIFVPAAAHLATYATQCLDYCAARGWEVLGVDRDWDSAAKAVRVGLAGVLLVARPDHLDPAREPRIEVVSECAVPLNARRERTRMIRRNAAR